jgi:hypothetical protein
VVEVVVPEYHFYYGSPKQGDPSFRQLTVSVRMEIVIEDALLRQVEELYAGWLLPIRGEGGLLSNHLIEHGAAAMLAVILEEAEQERGARAALGEDCKRSYALWWHPQRGLNWYWEDEDEEAREDGYTEKLTGTRGE